VQIVNERKYWLGKIKTKSSYEIGKFILFSVLFLFFATIITFPALFLNTGQQQSKKACIFAGHTSGSISDYRLEVYEDSTYYLSSLLILNYLNSIVIVLKVCQ